MSPSSVRFERCEMPASTEPKSLDSVLVDELATTAPMQYPTKGRLLIILLCLVLGTFLVAVDTTIISVAIPTISTDFKALNDVGWYGSVYLMTLTAFQPTMGTVYKNFDPKAAYIASIALFEGTISFSYFVILLSAAFSLYQSS